MYSKIIAIFLSVLCVSRVCEAATIYVDQAGLGGGACSDTRDRVAAQSAATPLCTLQRANAVALSGDLLIFRAGRYFPSARVVLNQNNLTLRAYNNEAVTIDNSNAGQFNQGLTLVGSGISVEGFEITNTWQECVIIYGANARIVNSHIHHCGLQIDESGVYQNCLASSGTNFVMEASHVHDSGSHVLYLTGNGITLRNNIIYRTTAPANRGSPIVKIGTDNTAASNVTIVHNIIAESANRSGIYLQAPNSSINTVTIANNVIYGNQGSYGWGIYADNAVTQFQGQININNNVFAANAAGNIISYTGSPVPSNFNTANNLTFSALSSLGFRNAAARDYYPLASSPLINAALNLGVAFDYAGHARPVGAAPDIGPYEYSAASVDTLAPSAPSNLAVN